MVSAWLPDATPFLADEIRDYAGGVPLFIEEFCLSARGGVDWAYAHARRDLARLPLTFARLVRSGGST